MRSLYSMDTIQIEILNACQKNCANCTRFCGHVKKPFFMSLDQFKEAVDSMVGYPKMTGVMGGEPLLHPQFEEFCHYIKSKIPKKQLGLWTGFPKGYERYREVICDTFYHIFLNDHTRDDIYHHSALVGVEEVFENEHIMWNCIDHCGAQESWSASINPRGAWFCEIAASMSILFEEGEGWKVEPQWHWKIPADFRSQMDMFCRRCGMSAPLQRRRSIEVFDDISPKNLERLKGRSRKIEKGEYVISDLKVAENIEPMASYKDLEYRNRIAQRYGIEVVINEMNFWTPILMGKKKFIEKSLYEVFRERNK